VILEGIVYCEGPECHVHARVGADTMAAGRLPLGWMAVMEYGGSTDSVFAALGLYWLMSWAVPGPPAGVVEDLPGRDVK
jgi:hypothetical protein